VESERPASGDPTESRSRGHYRFPEADTCYRLAIGLWEELGRGDPEDRYRTDLAHCYTGLALSADGADRVADAERDYRRAVTLLEARPGGPKTGDGRFTVTWVDQAADNPGDRNYVRRYQATGGAVEIGAYPDRQTQAAYDAAGNLTFTWGQWSGHSSALAGEVHVRQLSAAGVLGAEIIANTTTQGEQSQPGIAATGNGTFVVAWLGNGPGDQTGVFAQRFGPVAAGGSAFAGQWFVPVAGDFDDEDEPLFGVAVG
jgi:hypothetical protein